MAKLHYVPRFYLEEFTDPETPTEQTPYLHVLEKGNPKWEKRAPINVASVTDYYTFTDKAGKDRQDIEQALQLIESTTAPILTRRIFRQRLPTREQRLAIAVFLSSMLNRIPSAVENVQEFLAAILEAVPAAAHQRFRDDPQGFERHKKTIGEDTGVDLDQLTVQDLNPERYTIEANRATAAAMALSSLKEFAAMAAAMGWTFWVSRPPDYFITSDFPVGFINLLNPERPPGLASKDAELSLPLSRTMALAAGWANPSSIGFSSSPPAIVEEINMRTVMRANTIFSPSPRFPGVDIVMDEGQWISTGPPKSGVLSVPTESGRLVGISLPPPWISKGRKPLGTTR